MTDGPYSDDMGIVRGPEFLADYPRDTREARAQIVERLNEQHAEIERLRNECTRLRAIERVSRYEQTSDKMREGLRRAGELLAESSDDVQPDFDGYVSRVEQWRREYLEGGDG